MLLQAKRWAHRPPSEKRIKLVVVVVAISLVLFGIEYFFGWPEALTLTSSNGRVLR